MEATGVPACGQLQLCQESQMNRCQRAARAVESLQTGAWLQRMLLQLLLRPLMILLKALGHTMEGCER